MQKVICFVLLITFINGSSECALAQLLCVNIVKSRSGFMSMPKVELYSDWRNVEYFNSSLRTLAKNAGLEIDLHSEPGVGGRKIVFQLYSNSSDPEVLIERADQFHENLNQLLVEVTNQQSRPFNMPSDNRSWQNLN